MGKLEENTTHKGHLLVDALPIALQLVEDGTNGGKIIVRGEFARSGRATENKRIYPTALWEREIGKVDPAMAERKLYGELDHPNDGRTQLSRVSHLVTGLEIQQNGIVLGEAEALDTARGKDLQAMLRAGCKVGVSSRGYGSTRTNEKGEEVVQDDYNLVTFDFVAEPADTTAYPEVFSEDKERTMGTEAQAKEQEQAKAFADKVQAEAEAEANGTADRAQIEQDIIANLGKLSAEAREEIRSQLMADPAIGGARTTIEQIAAIMRPFILPEDTDTLVAKKDEEIKELNRKLAEADLKLKESGEQIESLASMAREAGYKYYLERTLAGDPDGGLVRSMLGDFAQFENADAFKARVQEVRDELHARRAEEAAEQEEARKNIEAREEAHKKELEAARTESQALRGELDKLAEALEKSIEANKEFGLEVYIEQRLSAHPRKAEVRKILEASNPRSKQAVDKIIQEHLVASTPETEDLEDVRSRVRRLTGGGVSPTPLSEEAPSPSPQRVTDYNGVGVDLGTLRELSGLPGHQAGR